MRLTRLNIHQVRNIELSTLYPHPQFNFFIGNNGGGKTTLLEAIYLLALGRSFRSRQVQSVITYHKETLACFGEILDAQDNKIAMGVEKSRQAGLVCKVAGEISRLSFFATLLPVQLLSPETFKLLSAGAQERRKFIDWGVFHVEHSFGALCLRYQRLLKQRNALLKQRCLPEHLVVWDRELVAIGEKITGYREKYMQVLLAHIQKTQAQLLPLPHVDFQYQQGWDPLLSLEEALARALTKDRKWGYTSVGPHRAEIVITAEGFSAHQVLSRGQQKLLICAMYIAQAEDLFERRGKKSVYLMDDLASELDRVGRQKVLRRLAEQNHQVFMTGVELPEREEWEAMGKMFHVEHGVFR